MNHFAVPQILIQHCKSTILQKNNILKSAFMIIDVSCCFPEKNKNETLSL